MADQCDRCSCVTEGWEDDLCLVCRVIVGLADCAELTDPDYAGWPVPAGGRNG